MLCNLIIDKLIPRTFEVILAIHRSGLSPVASFCPALRLLWEPKVWRVFCVILFQVVVAYTFPYSDYYGGDGMGLHS